MTITLLILIAFAGVCLWFLPRAKWVYAVVFLILSLCFSSAALRIQGLNPALAPFAWFLAPLDLFDFVMANASVVGLLFVAGVLFALIPFQGIANQALEANIDRAVRAELKQYFEKVRQDEVDAQAKIVEANRLIELAKSSHEQANAKEQRLSAETAKFNEAVSRAAADYKLFESQRVAREEAVAALEKQKQEIAAERDQLKYVVHRLHAYKAAFKNLEQIPQIAAMAKSALAAARFDDRAQTLASPKGEPRRKRIEVTEPAAVDLTKYKQSKAP